MKVAIFGDIGGQAELFEQGLIDIGCDPKSGYVPEGMTVIQVGDLIDRGPDSDGAFEIARSMLLSERYIQLVGNHEAQHLGGPKFITPGSKSELSGPKIRALKDLRKKGYLHMGVGIVTEYFDNDDNYYKDEYLITHGGLGVRFWQRYLAGETDLEKMVGSLNGLGSRAYDAGGLLGYRKSIAGPCWPLIWDEVMAEWIQYHWTTNKVMPWHQVFGHGSIVYWYGPNEGKYKSIHPDFVDNVSVINKESRISAVSYEGKHFYQVDPGYGVYSSWVAKPMVLFDVKEIYL